ncbi:MAG: sulfate reduction electron transfer complex DsrMKJOP subunit DsrP [Planctomycetota bacterium]
MFEKALSGSRRYWTWVSILLALIGIGAIFYLRQLSVGLTATGMGRDVTWALYIAQFTFLVGVAASAVMVVLPYYLHSYKTFGKLAILGEFLAIAAVTMCVLFIFVDMGRPDRVVNIILHPTPNSLMFWDMLVLNGYLVLNVVISLVTFTAERKNIAPPTWVKPLVILSIPWAISIHTVTAFLYSGLAGRPFWLTAILAPRFLASAFAGGPAILILLCMIVRRVTRFDVGRTAIQKLAVIVTYAMVINVFFVLLEFFTTLYSDIPEHLHHVEFLYLGLDGNTTLVPWMWASSVLAVVALLILLVPRLRRADALLAIGCFAVFGSIWCEKGLGMVIAGFVPSQTGGIPYYAPTLTELMITVGIYATGALVLTMLYKIAVTVRLREPEAAWAEEKPHAAAHELEPATAAH